MSIHQIVKWELLVSKTNSRANFQVEGVGSASEFEIDQVNNKINLLINGVKYVMVDIPPVIFPLIESGDAYLCVKDSSLRQTTETRIDSRKS